MMSVESYLKPGVDLRNLAPQWAIGYPIIQQCYHSRGFSCVVTNGNERTPEQLAAKPSTLHPSGRALDFRTKHIPMREKLSVQTLVKESLGAQWDVILEHIGMEQEHLHAEFQPKDSVPPET
jgi:hypothetical protein